MDRAQAFLFDELTNATEKVTDPDGNEHIALRAGSRANFVRHMREFMISEGMVEDEEEYQEVNQNDITDIRSESRLRLIYDTNIRQAYGYGQWKQGMTPAVLRRYPAQRFVRDREVGIKRERHEQSEGEVRLKANTDYWADYQNDPKIGGFGVPWAPFGFHSGMGVRDVSREEAFKLGLLAKRDEVVNPAVEGEAPRLNDNLQSSVKKMSPEVKQKLIDELRSFKAKDAGEAGAEAALKVREKNNILMFEKPKNKDYNNSIRKDERKANISESGELGLTASDLKKRIDEAIKKDSHTGPNFYEKQIAREREHLRKIVSENEGFVVENITESEVPETGEHNIRISDDLRFWKYTKGSQYGYVPFGDLPDIHNFSVIKLNITPATPRQYLERVKLSNKLFGDAIKLEGITRQGNIVISQTAVVGEAASRKQIAESLTQGGWVKIAKNKTMLTGLLDDSSWYHKDHGVVLVDARPANMLIDSKGVVYPIDVMLTKADVALRKLLE